MTPAERAAITAEAQAAVDKAREAVAEFKALVDRLVAAGVTPDDIDPPGETS